MRQGRRRRQCIRQLLWGFMNCSAFLHCRRAFSVTRCVHASLFQNKVLLLVLSPRVCR